MLRDVKEIGAHLSQQYFYFCKFLYIYFYFNVSELYFILTHKFVSFIICRSVQKKRLEHQRLNALVYVRYNTRLRERSLQRKQNVDPILVEEIDSDDEWIAKKEDPLLLLDLC